MSKQDLPGRLGRRIRELRGIHELTQEQLAERAGITFHYVSAIERGTKAPTVETVAALAEALGVTLSEIFLDVDRPAPKELKRISTALAGRPPEAQRTILRIVEEALRLLPS